METTKNTNNLGLEASKEDSNLSVHMDVAEGTEGSVNTGTSGTSNDEGKKKNRSGAAKKRARKAKLAAQEQFSGQSCRDDSYPVNET